MATSGATPSTTLEPDSIHLDFQKPKMFLETKGYCDMFNKLVSEGKLTITAEKTSNIKSVPIPINWISSQICGNDDAVQVPQNGYTLSIKGKAAHVESVWGGLQGLKDSTTALNTEGSEKSFRIENPILLAALTMCGLEALEPLKREFDRSHGLQIDN